MTTLQRLDLESAEKVLKDALFKRQMAEMELQFWQREVEVIAKLYADKKWFIEDAEKRQRNG